MTVYNRCLLALCKFLFLPSESTRPRNKLLMKAPCRGLPKSRGGPAVWRAGPETWFLSGPTTERLQILASPSLAWRIMLGLTHHLLKAVNEMTR